MLRNKRLGRDIERRAKKFLEDHGYFVIKTSVSDANPDLIAFKDGKVYFIEVKRIEKWSGNIPRLEKQIEKLDDYCRCLQVKSNIDAHYAVFCSVKIGSRYTDIMLVDCSYDEVISVVSQLLQ